MSDKLHYFTFSPDIARDASSGIPTSFSGVAYSGGMVPDFCWLGDVAIDLATMSVPDRGFSLVNHDPNQRAGHFSPTLDGNQLRVAGVFSKTTESGQSVAGEFSEGAPWKLSIGINGRFESYDRPTQVNVNGQQLIVDGIFRNARLLEVSFVYADADPNTSVSAFSANQKLPEPPMAEDTARIAALETQVAELTAKFAAEKTRADAAETALATHKSTARLAAVKALFESTGLEFSDAKAAPYLAMDETAFAAVSEALQSTRPAPDPSLFEATATHGKPATPPPVTLSAADIYAARAQRQAA